MKVEEAKKICSNRDVGSRFSLLTPYGIRLEDIDRALEFNSVVLNSIGKTRFGSS